MQILFADAFYWIALLNRNDKYYPIVKAFNQTLTNAHLITTDEILTEFLNFYSSSGIQMQSNAVNKVENILNSQSVTVIHQKHDYFLAGLSLYKQRLDKGYSLTDCISMSIMRELNIQQILTHDKHFAQERLTILF
jgi:predicted nucleic acid-binding protein